MPTVARICLPLAIACFGCSGGGGAEPAANTKLADDLVACQNERSQLKEKLRDAEARAKKAEEAASAVVKIDPPLELHGSAQTPEKHVEGNLPPEAVVKVFKANQGGLRACYEKGLKRNPNLQYVSAVNAHFAVKNTGNAIGVNFTPHADGEMERCMAQAITRWHFPSFTGDPVQFDYPVSLVAK